MNDKKATFVKGQKVHDTLNGVDYIVLSDKLDGLGGVQVRHAVLSNLDESISISFAPSRLADGHLFLMGKAVSHKKKSKVPDPRIVLLEVLFIVLVIVLVILVFLLGFLLGGR